MEEAELFKTLKQAIIAGDADETVRLVEGVVENVDPLALIEKAMMPGMTEIGDLFGEGEVFLPELLLASEAFQQAMKIIKPRLDSAGSSLKKVGTVVIGTVQTDIHALGKTILANLLVPAGFEVHDLGTDVSSSKFIDRAEEVNADIIAASAIMSTTMPFQKHLIESLEARGLRDKYIVMVGGGVVTQAWANEIGADGYAELASDAVRLATRLVAEKRGGESC